MTANEWLGVMQKAQDFPKGMDKLIIKYGEMLIAEHESKVKELNLHSVIKSVCDCTHTQACKDCAESKGIDWSIIEQE